MTQPDKLADFAIKVAQDKQSMQISSVFQKVLAAFKEAGCDIVPTKSTVS